MKYRVPLLLLICLLAPLRARAHGDHDPREADTVFDTLSVVIDAPWRVQRRAGVRAEVPVLFLFPETRAGWRCVRVRSIALSDASGPADVMLYRHRAGEAPQLGASGTLDGHGLKVMDAWGRIAPDIATVTSSAEPAAAWQVGQVNDDNRGFHVMLRLPVPDAPGATKLALAGQVEIERLDDAGQPTDQKVHAIRRRLEIAVDPEPLPMFPGWRTFDTHVHTIAECDTNTSFKALRKNHGGPVRMIAEAAASLGMIDDPDQPHGRVITTDHNVYYSDRDFPRVGITAEGLLTSPVQVLHPEWSPYFRGPDGKVVAEGQREFENYQNLFGPTRGEELSLAKAPGGIYGPIGALAAHMIVHGGRHFAGPFHGGKFLFWREENPNPVERVLPELTASPHFREPFAYAAHPFTESATEQRFGTYWNESQLAYAVRAHVTWKEGGREKEHVFRGFQLWNQRDDQLVDVPLHDRTRMARALEDPRREGGWAAGNPNWDHILNFGLMRWHQIICDGFAHASPAAPASRSVRKLYATGGSDAHGDFNRYSDCAGRGFSTLPFPLNRLMKGFSVGSNALGRVRIAVESEPRDGRSPEDQSMFGYAHGQSCVTDGPVLELQVDADGHFDQEQLAWLPRPSFIEPDGRMGGDGRMDGGRTALIATGSARPMLRFRWKSSAQFGGPLERLEVYRDQPGKQVKRIQVQRNTGPATVLAPDGHLDPHAAPGADGWRTVPLDQVCTDYGPMRPVETPAALSLGGFTARPATPPFDFRAYTNPVWMLPVSAGLSVEGPIQAGRLSPGQLRATIRFPVSMEERALEVRLIPMGADGASIGFGIALEPIPGSWGASARAPVASAVYGVTNAHTPVDLAQTHARRFCLVLRDPRDSHGNRLNSLAWVLEVPPEKGSVPLVR